MRPNIQDVLAIARKKARRVWSHVGRCRSSSEYEVKSDRHNVRLSSVEGFKQLEKISDM